MSETLNLVYETIDNQHAGESAATRRQIVAGVGATLGGMGLLGLVNEAEAAPARGAEHRESVESILNVAATAEVLATIANTVGAEVFANQLDPVTLRNVRAAAREELVHYRVLRSLGARELTKRIWIPNAAVASPRAFLSTLEVGDQVFVNAYLLATTIFANRTRISAGRRGRLARIAAEFMGVEAVHRALARQSLGKLGNDRVFMRYSQPEGAPDAPNRGAPGFRTVASHVAYLQRLGFGFGRQGATPGAFYDFDVVSRRTPSDPSLNTFGPR